jgi:hypothetical protein
MPNKTLYIRDEDTDAWERAEAASHAAHQSLSQYVANLLRRYAPAGATDGEQPGTEIKAGDKVTLRNGDPQKVGGVEGLCPMYGGWLSSGTANVLFVLAWVSWEGEKTLERVDDLIKLPQAEQTPDYDTRR